ncbi:protein NDR1-like [Rhododendron vialii]|uniref:protein NDR1-like n=1 Tax=Rhododendron vialii TaxID=182163 RepID=UPI00265D893B|nr:protein NDR1-like [Rhododendron vialii]
MSDSGDCGRCKCCSVIITLGLTALSLWLILRASNPICSIQDFYVPVLNKTLNSTTATTSIYFDIELDNPNRDEEIYYNTLDLTFYYKYSNQTYSPVANQTFVGFYQGFKKKARRRGTVKATGVPWGEVFGAVSNGSMPVFRVGLVTSFRFKVLSRKTKEHKLAVGADVAVNDSGEKDNQKGVRLKSGAPEMIRRGPTRPLVIDSVILFNLLFIST